MQDSEKALLWPARPKRGSQNHSEIYPHLLSMLASTGIAMLSLGITTAAIQAKSDIIARSTAHVRSGTVSTIFLEALCAIKS
jgi:hypothetical protein